MTIDEVLRRGLINIDDDLSFRRHVDVLRLFGKDLRAHMRATYKLEEDWRVWFPKLYGNNDFINTLSDSGVTLEMNQKPESLIMNDKIFPLDEPGQRIVFAHMINPVSKEKYYKFVGVFSELQGNMKHASCKRIAETLYLDGNGHFSTKP